MELNFSNIDRDGLYSLQLEGGSLTDSAGQGTPWSLPRTLKTWGWETVQRPSAGQELLSGALMTPQGNTFPLISSLAHCRAMRLILKDFNSSLFNKDKT